MSFGDTLLYMRLMKKMRTIEAILSKHNKEIPRDKLYFISNVDEKNRFYGLDVSFNEYSGQALSHGCSYSYANQLIDDEPLDEFYKRTFDELIAKEDERKFKAVLDKVLPLW